MVDQRLVNYVKRQLSAGYDINSIRAGLIKYGYNAGDIEQAIRAVKKKKLPLIPILAGLGLLIIIFGLLFVFRGEECVENWLCDSWQPVVCPASGQQTRTCRDMNNCGTAVDKPSVSRSCMYEEIVTEPGEDIEVVGLECPESCDDDNKCTDDRCSASTGYQCVHDVISPCCGNGECETGEDYISCPFDCEAVTIEIPSSTPSMGIGDIRDNVRALSNTPSNAADFCKRLDTAKHRDLCYNELAEITEENIYCDPISSDATRDNCYTYFALNGDYSVCNQIINKYLKESCIALSSI
jgi:hypothetical protein